MSVTKPLANAENTLRGWSTRICCGGTALAAAAIAVISSADSNAWNLTRPASSRGMRRLGRSSHSESVSIHDAMHFVVPDIVPTAADSPSASEIVNDTQHGHLHMNMATLPEWFPSSTQLREYPHAKREQRVHFWISLFALTHAGFVCVGTGVMFCGSRLKYHYDRVAKTCTLLPQVRSFSSGTSTSELKQMTGACVGSTIAGSLVAVLYSVRTNRLSKTTGLSLEMLYGIYCMMGLSMLTQASSAVHERPVGRFFPLQAFAASTSTGMLPLLSDAFKILTEMIFGGLCFRSEKPIVKTLGVINWIYLAGARVYLLIDDEGTFEFLESYLPVLFAHTSTVEVTPSTGGFLTKAKHEILINMYQQTTPSKRHVLVINKFIPVILALVYLWLEGWCIWVGGANVCLPITQWCVGCILFGVLRRRPGVRTWMEEEYVNFHFDDHESQKKRFFGELEDSILSTTSFHRLLRAFFEDSSYGQVTVDIQGVRAAENTSYVQDFFDVSRHRSSPEDVADDRSGVYFEGRMNEFHCKLIGAVLPTCVKIRAMTFTKKNELSEESKRELLCGFLECVEQNDICIDFADFAEDDKELAIEIFRSEDGAMGPTKAKSVLERIRDGETTREITFKGPLMLDHCKRIAEAFPLVGLAQKQLRFVQKNALTSSSMDILLRKFAQEYKEGKCEKVQLIIEHPSEVLFIGSKPKESPEELVLKVKDKSFMEPKIEISEGIQDLGICLLNIRSKFPEKTVDLVSFDFFPESALVSAAYETQAKNVLIPGEELKLTEEWETYQEKVMATRAELKEYLKGVSSTFAPSGKALDLAKKAGASEWIFEGRNVLSE